MSEQKITFRSLQVIERDMAGLEFFIVPVDGDPHDDIASGLIDCDEHSREEMRAWARLFGAAPDLLEIVRDISTMDCFYAGATCPDDCKCVAARASRALDKAEGRS